MDTLISIVIVICCVLTARFAWVYFDIWRHGETELYKQKFRDMYSKWFYGGFEK